jgi:hypothetical protein
MKNYGINFGKCYDKKLDFNFDYKLHIVLNAQTEIYSNLKRALV